MATQSSVGIVILDLDQRDTTARCLESLAAGSTKPALIVIVENGKQSNRQFHLRKFPSLQFVFLRPKGNLGCAGGRNLGLRYLTEHSEFDRMVILDNDAVVPEDFVAKVASLPKSFDVVAPKILHLITGRIWSNGGIILRDGSIRQLTGPNPREQQIVDWAPGACLIIARRLWEAVGEFDSWMNFYFEDIEWCLRVRRAGGRIVVDGNIIVLHEPSQSLNGE